MKKVLIIGLIGIAITSSIAFSIPARNKTVPTKKETLAELEHQIGELQGQMAMVSVEYDRLVQPLREENQEILDSLYVQKRDALQDQIDSLIIVRASSW
jgi:hypothetical protein